MTRPLFVILSGAPATGKSTLAGALAENLGVPLFEKDAIKERLADGIGEEIAADLSSALGKASVFHLYRVANALLSATTPVMIESFFYRGLSERDLRPLLPLGESVQIHLFAETDVVLERYSRRFETGARHAIHTDGKRGSSLRDQLKNGTCDTLDLDCPCISIDTTTAYPDPANVANQIREILGLNPH